MELSMTEQGFVFLFSCAVGIFLGAFYDIFRIIRIAFNSRWLSIFFQDFIFCIISALSVILLVFYTNSGTVRWFSLVGCFLCFLVYHLTVGKFIMFMAKKIIDFIKRVLNFIKSITVVPAVKLILFIIKLLKKFSCFMLERFKAAREYNYYKKEMSAAKREASRGFNLYKYKKVPASIKKAAESEIKKQAIINKSQEFTHKKAQPRKKSGKRTQSLGSLKELGSIKFK